MKRKIAAAAALATVLTAAACSSSSTTSNSAQPLLSTNGKGKTITCWIMTDAQKGWPSVVNAAVSAFTAETGAKVNIQWQTWTNYTTKLDTALLSNNAPDCLEIGNTQTAKYIAAGSFVNLTSVKSKFDNSSAWLQSLAASGESADGTQTYAIPYYAGARVMIYRKDMFAAAGVTTPPTTLAELTTDLNLVKAKYKSVPNFSALYLPGKDWYTATSFGAGSYGIKNVIASASGSKFTGTLTDPNFLSGINTWNTLQKEFSVGGTTVDETTQDALMAKGNIAAIIGNGWEVGSVDGPTASGGNPALANDLAEIPVPGTSASAPTPAFLGGSDVAVPSKAQNPGLGAEFLRIFTDTAIQTQLAKYAIPNNSNLMSVYQNAAPANVAAGDAAKAPTWFIPNSQFWSGADETDLQTAFSAIATGTDPATALGTAQTAIIGDLNGN